MIIITKLKQPKKYAEKELPNFETRLAKIMCLNAQKKLLALSTIKSVSIQIKDIKHMIFSEDSKLASLYAKFNLTKQFYSDDDYITITTRNPVNKSLIYSLINADWIINAADINDKSVSDLEQECNDLNIKISKSIEAKTTSPYKYKLDNKIILYQYKLLCLKEYLDSKLKSNGIDSTPEEEKNDSVNLSLVDIPIISESQEPVYTNAFTKVKTLREGYLVKSRSIYGGKNN